MPIFSKLKHSAARHHPPRQRLSWTEGVVVGAGGVVASMAAVLLARRGGPAATFVSGCANVAVAATLGWTLKHLIGRDRPDHNPFGTLRLHGPNLEDRESSFPSGHTTVAVAIAGSLPMDSPRQMAFSACAHAGALALGYSRLRKNRHWQSDIVGGIACGVAGVAISSAVLRLLEE